MIWGSPLAWRSLEDARDLRPLGESAGAAPRTRRRMPSGFRDVVSATGSVALALRPNHPMCTLQTCALRTAKKLHARAGFVCCFYSMEQGSPPVSRTDARVSTQPLIHKVYDSLFPHAQPHHLSRIPYPYLHKHAGCIRAATVRRLFWLRALVRAVGRREHGQHADRACRCRGGFIALLRVRKRGRHHTS
jgi:hypothetical protein